MGIIRAPADPTVGLLQNTYAEQPGDAAKNEKNEPEQVMTVTCNEFRLPNL